jgi:hypothetical protein
MPFIFSLKKLNKVKTKSSTANAFHIAIILLLGFQLLSCKKAAAPEEQSPLLNSEPSVASKASSSGESRYNLEVVLRGEGNQGGHTHFRQDRDAAKIIELNTNVHNLEPNHEYLLQRAVDPINVVDGNCTSTSWLTLGYGLTPHAIQTDEKGNGEDTLWRDVTAIPSGGTFDIHFRVVDAITLDVVLVSDCYQYTVR